jgi:hypothetical protein
MQARKPSHQGLSQYFISSEASGAILMDINEKRQIGGKYLSMDKE